MSVIMGTAGHIDHGKTTLIKALTGIDCDRLAEEQKRGITIELGFACLRDARQSPLGIVDVPGHERFVKNMVAGAAGIDFVLLVIAADEGVMPQTKEHLEICTLLGIKSGLVAVTKADMVDGEWLEFVQEDIRAFLQGSFLEDAPVLPVSAHTGEGFDALRQAILRVQQTQHTARTTDFFRLPVDRVFTMKGHGTVITGTTWSGTVNLGEELQIFPGSRQSRVRALQVHGMETTKAYAGERTAVNLQGLEVRDIERGQVLAKPKTLFPTTVWETELICLSSAPRALRQRMEVHLHHGACELQARLYFVDRERLQPGESALCQIHLPEAWPAVYGDRFIVRTFSPLRTVAGGRVLRPFGKRWRRRAAALTALEPLRSCAQEDLVMTQIELGGFAGQNFAELRILTAYPEKVLEKYLQSLSGRQQVFLIDREQRRYIGAVALEKLAQRCVQFVAAFHTRKPLEQGLSRAEVLTGFGQGLSAKLTHFLVERLVRQNVLILEGDAVRLPGHCVSLAADQVGLRAFLEETFEEAGLTPPTLNALHETHGLLPQETGPVFRLLLEKGTLLKVSEELYYAASAMVRILDFLEGYFATKLELTPSDFRTLTGLSRKFSIPVLEYLDRQKVTVRLADGRKLRNAESIGQVRERLGQPLHKK